MNNKIKNKSNIIMYFVAFLIPCISMICIFCVDKITPFGDKSLLACDMEAQYAPFFYRYKDLLLGGKDSLYSFSQTLGGENIGLISYYLLSPVNLILLLFNNDILNGITFLTIIKISLCGLTSFIYLTKRFNNRTYSFIIFSTCYALMGYNAAYSVNIMWLDGVILLPMVALGIYYLIHLKNMYLYTISLVLCIVSNYYIAYMICIFSVIYFAYELILLNNKNRVKQCIVMFIKYSILAGGIAAVLIFPTLKSLLQGKGVSEYSSLNRLEFPNLIDIFSKTIIGANSISEMQIGNPNIYCGIIVIILSFIYFFNKNISKRERIVTLFFIGILIIGCTSEKIDFFWHGFNTPTWYCYRYAFVISFFLILIAAKSFQELDHFNNKILYLFIGCYSIAIFITYVKGYSYLNTNKILITLIIALIYVFCINKIIISNKKSITILLLVIINSFELQINFLSTTFEYQYELVSDFNSYEKTIRDAISEVKQKDDGLYRTVHLNSDRTNEPYMFDYYGLGHFSSCESIEKLKCASDLGINLENGFIGRYSESSSPITECILGVKYVIDSQPNKLYNLLDYFPNFDIKDNLMLNDKLFLYENPYALSFAYLVDNNIVNYKKATNEFEILNDLVKIFRENNEDFYNKIEPDDIQLNNLTAKEDGEKVILKQIDTSKNASIKYIFNSIDDIENAYCKIKASKSIFRDIKVVNNYNYTKAYDRIIKLTDKNGQYILTIELDESREEKDSEIELENISFYKLNVEKTIDLYNDMKDNQMNILEHSNSYIKGEIEVLDDKKVIFTTIPYDNDWKCYIDGQEVEKIKILDGLLAVNINKGNHVIEFKYVCKEFYIGAIVSLVASILFIFFIKYDRKKINKINIKKE